MGSIQSLKSGLGQRVRVDQSERLFSSSRNLGYHPMCPEGGHALRNDVFGRPVSQNTLAINDAACAVRSEFPGNRIIAVENSHRPYLPICEGMGRGGDLMGVGRDMLPQNLYSGDSRGNMVRDYTGGMYPPQAPKRALPTSNNRMRVTDLSHDATSGAVYGRR